MAIGALSSAALLAVAASGASSSPVEAGGSRRCPDGGAVVHGADPADFADICRGVSAALTFFASHGARPDEPVAVEVTPAIPAVAGPTAAGCYIEQKRRVFVVPYSSFRKNKTWFGVAIDRAQYQRLATHEAAHAIAACNFRVANPTIQAKEYLAYAAMFSSMSPEFRNKVLRAIRTEGFDNFDRFTPILYMFDPMRFGAEAWRHYSSAPDQASVIQAVLGGQVLVD